MSDRPQERAPGAGSPGGEPPEEDGERPPRLAMLILVLFPFLLVLVIALLYGWIRR